MQRAGLGQGQQAQVFDQRYQVGGLLAQGADSSLVGFQQAVVYRFQVALNVGKGRSQFVGHVGYQVAALRFGGLQIFRHSVKGVAQVFNFAGAGSGDPLGQITLAQPAGGGAQSLHRG